MAKFIFMVILVTLIEFIVPQSTSSDQSDDYPLIKSLGYSIKGTGKGMDARLSQEFMEKYMEMKKASQESFENFEKKEEKRRRRVIGDDELDLVKEVYGQRRRSANTNKLQSAAGRRRARSQALRRDKLNSQSLRSHMHHSKQTNLDYAND